VLATLVPGELIGEMALLLPGGQRTAAVRPHGKTRLWVMTRADFDALLHRQPDLAYAMMRILSKRLDATNTATYRDLLEKNLQLQRALDDLKAAEAQLIEKERLERELQVASEIQMSILPQELPQVPGYEFGALMVPARMVGGDFYDVFFLDEGHLGFLIGDVADKGVPSAIFMARAHALIMAEASHGGSPSEILRRANQHLIHLEQADLFVTVLFGILELASREFSYARAGHEVPLLVNPTGETTQLPHATGQAIGILEDPRLDENRLVIPAGGILLLCTDGITDCTNLHGEAFGQARLFATLASLTSLSGQGFCDRLFETLQKHQSGAAQFDDITMVSIHASPVA
jgi:serine phosphatase RsbU (regulator of sigma subunit)